MTALSNKQRIKVNAALAIIHGHGFNANIIGKEARVIMGTGHPAPTAYAMALNNFAQKQPGVGGSIDKVTRLIEASDDATVAQYDQALNQYIQTGDDSGISALQDMIVADSMALAIRNGEGTEDTLAGLTIDDALAVSHDEMQDMAEPAPNPEPAPVPNQSFAFNAPGQATVKPSAPPPNVTPAQGAPIPSSDTAARASMSEQRARSWAGVPIGATPALKTAEGGYRSPKTGQALARAIGVPLASVEGQAAAASEASTV
ncbi:hypothetical protein [Sphingorhabdus sp. EL138]|uniref:hypothetical protein n=1 Tax=Sphingorhabdus sp. EL138 TaxID=2073156 RepID=UPI000D696E9C|nr:hypothetical protein [Sphingorhabdus sp. EL138]